MAEIQTNNSSGKKRSKSKQKKMEVFIDFTPMVDMNMLLITFFMLATTLSKPQTMELSMPSNEKVEDTQKAQVKASLSITLLPYSDNKLYYYAGQPDYQNYNSLKELSYDPASPNSLRSLLMARNKNVVDQINELKKQKMNLEISQDTFAVRSSRIKNGKNTPVVIIKPADGASYKNLVDVLDEMLVCSIGKYVIDTITPGDLFLIKNKESNGAYALSQKK